MGFGWTLADPSPSGGAHIDRLVIRQKYTLGLREMEKRTICQKRLVSAAWNSKWF